jgi:hypothetical protein
MEEVDQELYSIVDVIPSMLEEGQIDQAITLWETTFESLGSQLSIDGKLSAMSFYAQALHFADLGVRAREVDMQIEELLGGMKEDEVSRRLREGLLRDIAERWSIEVGDQIDASPSPGPPSEASTQTQELSGECSPLRTGGEGNSSVQTVQVSTPGQMDQDTAGGASCSVDHPNEMNLH